MGVKLSIRGTAPNAPANLQSTPIATDKIDLVWESNSNDIMGFRIERSAGNNANFIEIASSIQGSATSYNDDGRLKPGHHLLLPDAGVQYRREFGLFEHYKRSTYSSTPLVPANPSILQASASVSQPDNPHLA